MCCSSGFQRIYPVPSTPLMRCLLPLGLLALAACGMKAPKASTQSIADSVDALPTDTLPTDTLPTDTLPTDTLPSPVLVRAENPFQPLPLPTGYRVVIDDSTDTLFNLGLEESHSVFYNGYAMGSVYRFIGILPNDTLYNVYKIENSVGTDEIFVFGNANPATSSCGEDINIRFYRINYDHRHYINRLDVIDIQGCYQNVASGNVDMMDEGREYYRINESIIRFCVIGGGMSERMYEYNMITSEINVRHFYLPRDADRMNRFCTFNEVR